MKCENCGQDLNVGDVFCSNCGSSVNNTVVDVNKDLETSNDVVGNSSSINTFNNPGETNNIISNNQDINVSKKKKNKSKVIIFLSVIFVLIVGALIALYLFTRKSAKDIFVIGFKKTTNEVFSSNYLKKKAVSQTIKFNINGSGLNNISDVYNNMVINNNMAIDINNKKLDDEISLNYDGSNILNIGLYARDNNVYLGFNGLYDKYVKLPITKEQYNYSFKIDNKAMKSAIDEAFIKTFDNKYFTKSKEKVTIDGKIKKVDAYTLTIDNSNVKDIMKNFIENLVNNKEFISMLSENYNVDANEIKNSINEIDYSELVMNAPISITIYTKGFNYSFVGIEFIVDNSTSLRVLKKDNNNLIATINLGTGSIDATINKKEVGNKSTITTNLDMMGLMNMSMIIDSIDNKNVEFKNIDNKDSIEYKDFIKNDVNDVVNKISKNEKLIELIGKLNNSSGGDINYSSLITNY